MSASTQPPRSTTRMILATRFSQLGSIGAMGGAALLLTITEAMRQRLLS